MTPAHTRRKGKLYRYYVATNAIRSGEPNSNPICRIPASEIEAAVVEQIKLLVRSPEIVVATWRAARHQIEKLTEREVREHLQNFTELWSELFPAEQARIIQLLVARVEINTTGANVTLRTDALSTLLTDIRQGPSSTKHGREEAA
jgi:hypothetical protein